MKLIEAIKRFFNRSNQINQESISNQSYQSLQSLKSQNQTIISSPPENNYPQKTIEIEKDSLTLGVAAGYTGRTLKEIENSLNRIESQMITKDWYLAQEAPKIELFKSMLTTLNNIQNSLNNLSIQASGLPLPIKSQINQKIEEIKTSINETEEKILNILKEMKEISYTDLANKAGLTESGLRGILSILARKDNRIKRFKIRKRGWVKFIDYETDLTEHSAKSDVNQ
jgi:hypothetical protein